MLGAKLAGKQATIRDFFLGGRKLPWPAVTGSIIATEISAVTFIGVPAILGKNGMEKVIEIDLSDDEKAGLEKSVGAVRKVVEEVNEMTS